MAAGQRRSIISGDLVSNGPHANPIEVGYVNKLSRGSELYAERRIRLRARYLHAAVRTVVCVFRQRRAACGAEMGPGAWF